MAGLTQLQCCSFVHSPFSNSLFDPQSLGFLNACLQFPIQKESKLQAQFSNQVPAFDTSEGILTDSRIYPTKQFFALLHLKDPLSKEYQTLIKSFQKQIPPPLISVS